MLLPQNLTLAIKPLPAFLGILVPLGIGDALQEFIQIKVGPPPRLWRQLGLPRLSNAQACYQHPMRNVRTYGWRRSQFARVAPMYRLPVLARWCTD